MRILGDGGKSRGKKEGEKEKFWYDNVLQTVKTGITMVRKSPLKSMVLVINGLSIGGTRIYILKEQI